MKEKIIDFDPLDRRFAVPKGNFSPGLPSDRLARFVSDHRKTGTGERHGVWFTGQLTGKGDRSMAKKAAKKGAKKAAKKKGGKKK